MKAKFPQHPGPDLLARYLGVYMQSRQMSDMERPWGLGDDELDPLWTRLVTALSSDPERLNLIISTELSDVDREHIMSTLAPLIFALPLRTFPVELRVMQSGEHLLLFLRNADETQPVGFLPAALGTAFVRYLRQVLHLDPEARSKRAVISSGGRRRRVSVTLFANAREAIIRFLERLPSPAEEH